jgi:hypothetical protein
MGWRVSGASTNSTALYTNSTSIASPSISGITVSSSTTSFPSSSSTISASTKSSLASSLILESSSSSGLGSYVLQGLGALPVDAFTTQPRYNHTFGSNSIMSSLASGTRATTAAVTNTAGVTTQLLVAHLNTTAGNGSASSTPALPSTGSGSVYASLCNAEWQAWAHSTTPSVSVGMTTAYSTYVNWTAQIVTPSTGCDTHPRVVGSFTPLVSRSLRL